MHTAPRYLLVVLAVVISGHYLLSFTTTSYPRFLSSASSNAVNPNAKSNVPMEYYYSQVINSTHTLELANRKRANATFVILARNSDLDSTVRSVREMEDRFNRRHGYPFVLLNDEPFTEEFKRRLNAVASGEVFYGQVPREHWVQPDWVDEDRATKGREQLVADNVICGGSVSYRTGVALIRGACLRFGVYFLRSTFLLGRGSLGLWSRDRWARGGLATTGAGAIRRTALGRVRTSSHRRRARVATTRDIYFSCGRQLQLQLRLRALALAWAMGGGRPAPGTSDYCSFPPATA
ncbi:glycolipid 2-alpha-mannosyltransferase-domain-containing protein [Mycena metata]|uniref:Glycolipid 2-alpha-mannosyltransferase-domain-containing protein n=1 Tax=Mycena metata TaxID=1033252 RepID=A0AAD7IED7_9AGAR|nr:glycolipid 2-alpha-mannosyltransferase-domain-containing protein [Mycena metata]